MRERRRHPRREIRIHASLRRHSRLQRYYTRNLSGGGMFLEVDDPPAVGDRVEIELEIPGKNEPVLVTAEVVRHHSFKDLDDDMNEVERTGIGVRFVDMPDEAKRAIEDMVAQA